MENNTAIYIYIALSIITIGILIVFLLRAENKTCSSYKPPGMSGEQMRDYYEQDDCVKRDKCLCSSGGIELCANKQNLLKSYEDGNNENQDFAAMQLKRGGPYWKNTNWMPVY